MDVSVSVIICAYNASTTIRRSALSALNSPEASKVIIVDDASSDQTSEIIKDLRIADPRIDLIRSKSNRGPGAARNLALARVRSEWVCILDSDDFFLPGRLKGLLDRSAKADMVADDMWRVDESNIDGPRQLFLGSRFGKQRFMTFEEFVSSNVTDRRHQRGELGFIKPLMRRSFLESHNLRYQEHMRLGEDYELYARALACGARMLLVPAQGYVSVVRANSLSGRHSEYDLLQLRDCDDRLAALPGLSENDRSALRRHYLSVDCRLQWRLLINAVKARNWRAAFETFLRPMPVPTYLVRQLVEQLILRVGRKFK